MPEKFVCRDIRSWNDIKRLSKYLDEKPIEKWTPSDHRLHNTISRTIQIHLYVTGQTKGSHFGISGVKERVIEW